MDYIVNVLLKDKTVSESINEKGINKGINDNNN